MPEIKESKKHLYQNYSQRNSKNLLKTWGGTKSVITLKSKPNISKLNIPEETETLS